MSKFKVDDLVVIVKSCICDYSNGCELLEGLNQIGKIMSKEIDDEWRVRLLNGKHCCHFKEEQLILKEKEIKLYGIAKFCLEINK